MESSFVDGTAIATRVPFVKLLNLVWSERTADVRSRNVSRIRERFHETRESILDSLLRREVFLNFEPGEQSQKNQARSKEDSTTQQRVNLKQIEHDGPP